MDFQKELSRNARDIEIVMREQEREKAQKQRDAAARMAQGIWDSIKQDLLACVQRGEYKKENNRGTVKVYYTMPRHYVDSNPRTEYKRDGYTEKNTWYNLQPSAKASAEYNHLRFLLDQLAEKDGVELSWVFKMKDGNYETVFPSVEPVSLSLLAIHNMELAVKAVTHFALNPELPIDYISDEEKRKQTMVSEKKYREAMEKKKNSLAGLVFSCALLAVYIYLFYKGYLEGIMYVIFGVVILLAVAMVADFREKSHWAEYAWQNWKNAEREEKKQKQ